MVTQILTSSRTYSRSYSLTHTHREAGHDDVVQELLKHEKVAELDANYSNHNHIHNHNSDVISSFMGFREDPRGETCGGGKEEEKGDCGDTPTTTTTTTTKTMTFSDISVCDSNNHDDNSTNRKVSKNLSTLSYMLRTGGRTTQTDCGDRFGEQSRQSYNTGKGLFSVPFSFWV